MELVLFDDGAGIRVGVARKNHIVDGRAAGVDLASLDGLDPTELQRLAGLIDSCPTRNALRRRSEVKVLASREV